jgi:gas vesicle protein
MFNHKKYFVLFALSLFPAISFADSQVSKDLNNTAKDTKVTVKKAVRNTKDKTCELVNGKLECAAKKMKHKAENAADNLGK